MSRNQKIKSQKPFEGSREEGDDEDGEIPSAAKSDPLALRSEFVFTNRSVLFGLLDEEMKQVKDLTPTFTLPSNRFSKLTLTQQDATMLATMVTMPHSLPPPPQVFHYIVFTYYLFLFLYFK